ncbi:hypothetical protein IWQ62_002116 [Dispira parvispora]|uniref:Transmembrane protein 19 n=1 Tax=Dispira parvispora TaxID=1520584 RepID=A0A9W8AQP6_9FUNG|nr:hypothetical protein IWQ62_002116 [Dispira parvispora]
MRPVQAVFITAAVVLRSLKHKSLSPSGALAAAVVGLGTFSNDVAMFTVTLLAFFLSSSKLTKLKSKRKQALDAHYAEGGQRDLYQVFSNGLTGTLLSLVYTYYFDGASGVPFFDLNSPWARTLVLMYVTHYACCNGDTWASELGVLHKQWPVLITTLHRVPPGTNGGISSTGLLASLGGGAVIGWFAAFSLWVQFWYRQWDAEGSTLVHGFPWFVVATGALGGLLGSLVDSVLGAVLQSSYLTPEAKVSNERRSAQDKLITGYNVLSNNQVNFIASLSTALLVGWIS